VAHRQHGELNTPIEEKRAGPYDGRFGTLLRQARERGIDLAICARVKNLDLEPHKGSSPSRAHSVGGHASRRSIDPSYGRDRCVLSSAPHFSLGVR